MPISHASVTNTFHGRSGKIKLSLLDTDFSDLVAFLNTTLSYSNYLVDSGVADHYVVNFDGNLIFTLTDGQVMQVKITHANTGACDIAVNGGAAEPIVMQDGSDPAANAFVAGTVVTLVLVGGKWQCQGTPMGAVLAAIAGGGGFSSALIAALPAALANSGSVVKQTIWIPAGTMFPSIAPLNGPNTFLVARNLVSGGTEATIPQFVNAGLAIGESMQFDIAFPKGWNAGTITFQPFWLIATGAAISGSKAKFQLQGVAVAGGGSMNANFGTAVGVEQDTTTAVAYTQYVTAESGAVTIAGTPTNGKLSYFKLQRVAASSSDIDKDLTLLGVKINYTAALSDA